AEQEVRVGVARLAAVEGEYPVVVEQGVVHDLLVRDLAPELERVLAAADAEGVAHGPVVAARVRPRDRGLAGEEPGDGEAREGGIALDLELGAEVAERRRGIVHAAAE